MKQKRYVFFLIVLIFILCGCVFDFNRPPYTLSKPIFINGTNDTECVIAGIEFSITNTADIAIDAFYVSFFLYSNDEENNGIITENNDYLIGSNKIEAMFEEKIKPNETKHCEIILDDKFYIKTEYSFFVDYFYVKKIKYENNYEWTDFLGTYFVRGDYEEN